MTIAAGFACTDGILLCADQKHVTGASQFSAFKIIDIADGNCQFLVAVGGHVDYTRGIADLLRENLDLAAGMKQMRAMVESAAQKVYRDSIASVYGARDIGRPQIEAIVALTHCKKELNADPQLLKVVDSSVSSIRNFDCVGSGSDIARFYIKWLYPFWEPSVPMHVASVLASHIVILAEAYDPECGDGAVLRTSPSKSSPPKRILPGVSVFSSPIHQEFGVFMDALRELILGCVNLEISTENMAQRIQRLSDAIIQGKAADAAIIQLVRNMASDPKKSTPQKSEPEL